jgi:hypothetical protein
MIALGKGRKVDIGDMFVKLNEIKSKKGEVTGDLQ